MDLRRRCERRWRYPLKADPSRQWRLLDLQGIDTRLDQIAHARARLPQEAAIAVARSELTSVETDLVNAETALGDVQRDLTKSDQDVQLVRDRAARDRARLESGSGTAKDLQALQHELASLARRQAELEDIELEVMERSETLAARVSELTARREAVAARIAQLEAERDAAVRTLEDEAGRVGAGRADIAAGVGEDLLALYEKLRASSGGVAVAELRHRRCGGCRLELNNVELSRVRSAAEDEVLRCEECRRIMVRTAESGL